MTEAEICGYCEEPIEPGEPAVRVWGDLQHDECASDAELDSAGDD